MVYVYLCTCIEEKITWYETAKYVSTLEVKI